MLEPEKYSLFDRRTNQRVEMPVEKVQESINSGRFTFGNEAKVPLSVKDEEGNDKIVPVSPDIARKYMRRGAKWLSPKAHDFQKDAAVYGDDVGDDILAGLTGVVDGLGLVDEFSRGLSSLGVPGIRERVIHNPVPHALGNIAVNVPIAMLAAKGVGTPLAPVALPVAAKAGVKVGLATRALYKALGAGKKGLDVAKGALRPIAPFTPTYHTTRMVERAVGGVADFSKAKDHWNTAQKVAAVGGARVAGQFIESGFYGAGYAASELDLKDIVESPEQAAEYIGSRAGWSALIGVGAQLGFAIGIPTAVGTLGWTARSIDKSWDWFAETNLARGMENAAAEINIRAKRPEQMIGETAEQARVRRKGEVILAIGIGKEAEKNRAAHQKLGASLSELKVHMVDTMTEAYDLDLVVKQHEQNGHSRKSLVKIFREDLDNINPLDTIDEAQRALVEIEAYIQRIREKGQKNVSQPEKGWVGEGQPRKTFIESPDYEVTLKRWEKRASKIRALINKTLVDTADAKIFPEGKVKEAHQAIISEHVSDLTANASRVEFVSIDRDFVKQKAPDIDTTEDVPYVFMVKNVDRDVPRGIPDELDQTRWNRGEPEEVIYFDYDRAVEAYGAEKKPWNNPTLKGVVPLQEIFYELQKKARMGDGEFKSSLFGHHRDWIEFLVHHELAHIEVPRKEYMNRAIDQFLNKTFGYRFSHLTEAGQEKIVGPMDAFREQLANHQRNQEVLQELNDELKVIRRGETTETGRSEKEIEEAIVGFKNEELGLKRDFEESVKELQRVFRANTRDDIIGDEGIHQTVVDSMEASGRRAEDLTDQITGLGLQVRRKIEIIKEELRVNQEGQNIARARRLEGEDGQDELLLKLKNKESQLIQNRKELYDFKRIVGKGFPERKELDYTRIPGAASDVQAIESNILRIEDEIKEIVNRSLRDVEEAPKKTQKEEELGPFAKYLDDAEDDMRPAKTLDEESRLNEDYERIKELIGEREKLVVDSRNRILSEDRRAGEARVKLEALKKEKATLLKRLATAGDKRRVPHDDEVKLKADIAEVKREIVLGEVEFADLAKKADEQKAKWDKAMRAIIKLNEGNDDFKGISTEIDTRAAPDADGPKDLSSDILEVAKAASEDRLVYLGKHWSGMNVTYTREFIELLSYRKEYLRIVESLEAKEDALRFLEKDYLPEKEDHLKELVQISELKFYGDKKKSYSVNEIQELRDEFDAVQAALIRAYKEVSPTLPKTLKETFDEISKLEAERVEIYKRAKEIQKDEVGKGDKLDDRFYEITRELDEIEHIESIIKTNKLSDFTLEQLAELHLIGKIRGNQIPHDIDQAGQRLSAVNINIIRQIDNKAARMELRQGEFSEHWSPEQKADYLWSLVEKDFGRRKEELLAEFYGRFDNEDVRMNIEEGKSLSGRALQKAQNGDLNIANLLQKRRILNEVLLKESSRIPDEVSDRAIALDMEISRVEAEIRSRTRKKFSKNELTEYNKRLVEKISKTYKELDALSPDGDPVKRTKLIKELGDLSEKVSDNELRIREFKKDSDIYFQAELDNLEAGIRIHRKELDIVYKDERARVKEVEKSRRKIADLIKEFQRLDEKHMGAKHHPSEWHTAKGYINIERRKLDRLQREGLENKDLINHHGRTVDWYHTLLDELDYARKSIGSTGNAETLAVDEARLQGIKRRVLELRDYSHQQIKVHPEIDRGVDPIAEFNRAGRGERGEGTPLEADEVLSRVETDRVSAEFDGEPVSALGTDASYENFLNRKALENTAALDMFSPVSPESPLHSALRNANRNTAKIKHALKDNPPKSGKSHQSINNPVGFLSNIYSQLEALSSDIHMSAREKHISSNADIIDGVTQLKNYIRKFISSSEEFNPNPNNLTEGTGKRTWGAMAEEKSRLDEVLKEQHEAHRALEEKFIVKDPEAPLEKKASLEAISKWVNEINYITKDSEFRIVETYLDTTVELLETLLGKTISANGRVRFEPGRYLNLDGLPKEEALAKYASVKRQLKEVKAIRKRVKETIKGIKENEEPALRYWEDIQREFESGQDVSYQGDLAFMAAAGTAGFFLGGPLGAGAAMMGAGGAKAVAGAGSNPRRAGAKLNMLRSITTTFKEGIDNTVNGYFDSYLDTKVSFEKPHPFSKKRKPYHYRKKVTGGAIWPRALTSNAVARMMHEDPEEHFSGRSSEKAKYSDGRTFGRDEFNNTKRIVKTLKENPEAMEIVMNKAFGSVEEFAPTIGNSMKEQAIASIDRLYEKLPEEIPSNSIFEGSYPPSDYSIAQFGDFLALEEFGMYAALDFLEEGSFTPDHMSYLAKAKPYQTIRAQEIMIDKVSSPEMAMMLPERVKNGMNLFLNYKDAGHLTEIYQETYMGRKKGPQAGPGGGSSMELPGGETMGGIVERANIGVV